MWSKTAIGAFQRAIATADKWDEQIRRLEAIAQHSPAFLERVRQLRLMRDNLHAVSSAAIAIDPEGNG